GFDAQHFSAPPDVFHEYCLHRWLNYPDNLLTTATHDHKRGEDARARLAVVSERPAWFAAQIARWQAMAQTLKSPSVDNAAPHPADDVILYQTLLATWPPGLMPDNSAAMDNYLQRLLEWQRKALREAKLRSSWD